MAAPFASQTVQSFTDTFVYSSIGNAGTCREILCKSAKQIQIQRKMKNGHWAPRFSFHVFLIHKKCRYLLPSGIALAMKIRLHPQAVYFLLFLLCVLLLFRVLVAHWLHFFPKESKDSVNVHKEQCAAEYVSFRLF